MLSWSNWRSGWLRGVFLHPHLLNKNSFYSGLVSLLFKIGLLVYFRFLFSLLYDNVSRQSVLKETLVEVRNKVGET